MSEPALKFENNAIFKQNYTLEMFIALKMLLFGLKGKSRFSIFPPKKFYNINCWNKSAIRNKVSRRFRFENLRR